MTSHSSEAGVPLAVQLDFVVLLTAAERAALVPPPSPFGTLPELPPELYAAWRLRGDLFRTFDLGQANGYAGLWMWMVRDGRREIDALGGVAERATGLLTAQVAFPGVEQMPVEFPWIAALLWLERPDLQSSFPFGTLDAMARYLGWFLRTGVFDGRCGDLLPAGHLRFLSAPGQSPVPPPMVRYLELLCGARPDLRERFDMASFDGRRDYVKWFFGPGIEAFPTDRGLREAQARLMFDWGANLRAAGSAAS